MEIVTYIGMCYLMFYVVEHGETKFQRSIGYFGSSMVTVAFLSSVCCYAFNLETIAGIPCD